MIMNTKNVGDGMMETNTPMPTLPELFGNWLAVNGSPQQIDEWNRMFSEAERLRQGYWDARAIMGFDNDGDPTPLAVSSDFVALMLSDARDMRRDYDESLATRQGETTGWRIRFGENCQLKTDWANMDGSLWGYTHDEVRSRNGNIEYCYAAPATPAPASLGVEGENELLRDALSIALQHVPAEGEDADAIHALVKQACPTPGEALRQRSPSAVRKHQWWGAGEPDCPKEIKAGNGELHTLRCKVCGTSDSHSPCFPLSQEFVTRATASDGPDVSVIGTDQSPVPTAPPTGLSAEEVEAERLRAALVREESLHTTTLRHLAVLEEAAQAMLDKLNVIHADERYQGVWLLAHNHGQPYGGPNYLAELTALQAALRRLATPPQAASEQGVKPVAVDVPDEIAAFILECGEVTWVGGEPMTAEQHGEGFAEAVRITNAKHGMDGQMVAVHGLALGGGDGDLIALTGTSPNSATSARALVGLWNYLLANIRLQAALAQPTAGKSDD